MTTSRLRPVVPTARVTVPRPAAGVVVRERLLQRLPDGRRTPLTLVHGPAGSGKTLLVATWAASAGPVGWVTLDSDVDAPGPFWAHVLTALRGCAVPLGDEIGEPAQAEQIDRSFLARLAATLSELDRDVVLVVDEYERVASGTVDADLDFVLRNAAPRLRLVVISRWPPRLRLARYRAAGQLTEIGPRDLAFTPDETAELFRLHDVTLTGAPLEDLWASTDGWVTALRLSALALHRGADPAAVRQLLTSGHGDSAEFLLGEIVDELPTASQDLLLRTCLLDPVRPDLADHLTGRSDAEQVLDRLARDVTFVRAVPGEAAFRYHDLLAKALRARLRHTQPELLPWLRRRSSQWLADHGRLTEAVDQAVAVADWSLAAGHVVDDLAVGQLLVGLDTHRLGVLFSALPSDVRSPEVCVVRAALAMAKFDAVGSTVALDDAVASAADVVPARRPSLRLGTAAVRLIVSRLTGDWVHGQAAGTEALQLMAQVPSDRLSRHPELVALVRSSLGTLQLWSGAGGEAEENLNAGLAADSGPGTEHARSNCLGQLAVLHWLRGELHDASSCAMQALQLVDRSGLSPVTRVPVGHLAAAAVAWEWDDLPAMRVHLEQAASSLAAQHDATLAVLLALLRARHQLAHGEAGRAFRTLGAAHAQLSLLPPGCFLGPLLALEEVAAALAAGDLAAARTVLGRSADTPETRCGEARLLLAEGRSAEARQLLDALVEDRSVSTSVGVRAQVVRGQALEAAGQPAQARRQLAAALRRARPEGFRRPFVEVRPWTRRVLAADPDLARQHGWLGARLTGSVPPVATVPATQDLVAEPLSERELTVLRMVARPMSNREIAAELTVSPNTVKTHLASAYRKLAAPNRYEAVRRATRLGLM